MVNTGFPSKACHTCRRRRVKLAFVYAPTEHWEAHVKPFLLSQFIIVTLHGARVYGSLDFLPQLLERAGTESTLYKVCDAIASAYFAKRTRSDSIEFGHRKLYVRALQSLSNDVSDVEKQSQDTTLAAVWLLCLYELIVGARGQEPRGWRTHGEALIGLLRLRGQNQFQTRTGCQLFQLAYRTVVSNTNDTNRPDAATGSTFLYGDLASRVYGTICDLIDQCSYDKLLESIDDIIIACKPLESSIDTVVTQGPALQSQPGPSDDLVTGQSHEWLMKQHAANYLGACLFQLYQGTVELLSQTLKANGSPKKDTALLCLRESNIERLKHLADRTLVSLALLLPVKAAIADRQGPNIPTWGHALKLLWPLGLISSSAHVHESQRAAANLGLLRIGHEAGIMQAVGR
ncbi:hypothetical protein F9C07_2257225 [Aspergillus flavus]|uniref:Uncharacterized protein n=1 Tax=Aspergillus flavus (strain ATCC 200026 / FGSC A1120 / IAM 13836 / NRRL 3357 / JCM 12722 / SRRC 167) TaxID=332952 RepID=A0A7U2MVZ2_ASPFN|nr:hypothetical protein F9C07_2257225 [Aspergillus flavus]